MAIETYHFPVPPEPRSHLIVNCIFMFLAVVIVLVRLWGRVRGAGVGWDDMLVVLATLMAISLISIEGFYCTAGMGYGILPGSPQFSKLQANFPLLLRAVFAFEMLYLEALAVLKCSVLCFYLRVFAGTRIIRLVKYALAAVVIWALAFTLGFFLVCDPVPFQWDPSIPGGKCGDQISLYATLIITNIIGNLFVMGLPMWTIWRLQMRTVEKVALTACFALGLAVVATTCARLATVFQNDMRGNFTGTMPTTIFLCVFEVLLGVICVSIPMLGPIYAGYRSQKSVYHLKEHASDPQSSFEDSSNQSSKAKFKNSRSVSTAYAYDRPYAWELQSYGGRDGGNKSTICADQHVENCACSDDNASERRLRSSEKVKSPQIAVETKWAITRE